VTLIIKIPFTASVFHYGVNEVQPSLMQSPALSNSCKCLMSILNPSSGRLWRPYMTGKMFSCAATYWLR